MSEVHGISKLNFLPIAAYTECKHDLEFQCTIKKRCILKEAYCDGHYDCEDQSDEPPNCNSTHKHRKKCNVDRFDCKDGSCIPYKWVCDGDCDCTSGDDEKHCSKGTKFSQFNYGTIKTSVKQFVRMKLVYNSCHIGYILLISYSLI